MEAEPSAALKDVLMSMAIIRREISKHLKERQLRHTFSTLVSGLHMYSMYVVSHSPKRECTSNPESLPMLLQRRTTTHLPADAVKAAGLPGGKRLDLWHLEAFRTSEQGKDRTRKQHVFYYMSTSQQQHHGDIC